MNAEILCVGTEILLGDITNTNATYISQKLAEKGIKGALTVSGETREISGGVIVRQGNIEVNCAVETLVQLRRSELASQVAEILFA